VNDGHLITSEHPSSPFPLLIAFLLELVITYWWWW